MGYGGTHTRSFSCISLFRISFVDMCSFFSLCVSLVRAGMDLGCDVFSFLFLNISVLFLNFLVRTNRSVLTLSTFL